MRKLITITLCIFIFNGYGQTTYKNKIERLKELNIYGNNAKINIGKITIDQTLETKLYLVKATQIKDTSNNYVTTFYFGNNQMVALFGAKIVLKFSEPVISADFGGLSTAMGIGWELSADKSLYTVKAQQINRDPDSKVIISVTVVSRDKIKTNIFGVDGILPNSR